VADCSSLQLMRVLRPRRPLCCESVGGSCGLGRRRSKYWLHFTQRPPPLAIEQLAGEANCRGLPPTFQRGDEEGRRVCEHRDSTALNPIKFFKIALGHLTVDWLFIKISLYRHHRNICRHSSSRKHQQQDRSRRREKKDFLFFFLFSCCRL